MNPVITDDEEFSTICENTSLELMFNGALENHISKALNEYHNQTLSIDVLHEKVTELRDRMIGFDFLDRFLSDETVSEIMVNGNSDLFIEKFGQIDHYKLNISDMRLDALIQRMVAKAHKQINLRSPIVDARLPCGSRLNIVIKPVALNGPVITIRKFNPHIRDLEQLEEKGALSKELKLFFKKIVVNKKSIFVSGGTSSGKTTLLNCLCSEIPDRERIITVEDSAELCLERIKNIVSLETRTSLREDLQDVGMEQLIKTSLRMRPDRIIVGEIRGGESLMMLQAMNTGHDGSMSTGHANSAKDMLQRIMTMALTAGIASEDSIKRQIASGLDYIIHMERDSNGKRIVKEVIKILGVGHNDEIDTLSVFKAGEEIVNSEP